MKTAVITGITGQDASYLAEHLIHNEYNVIGIKRRSNSPNYENIESIKDHPNFKIVTGDITDYSTVSGILNTYKPDEVYNLAAQSFVGDSFSQPIHTFDVNTLGVTNLLEVIRQDKLDCKMYQASTSEMFGSMYSCERYDVVEHFNIKKITPDDIWAGIHEFDSPAQKDEKRRWLARNKQAHINYPNLYPSMDYCKPEPFQNENTPFSPQSPYGVAKLAAHHMCRLYREAYGVHVSCGILFNHESPRRGKDFVTRKITNYIGGLVASDDRSNYPKLKLGNLDTYRDWGHAKDYVKVQHLILQQEKPDDYVICTGETHSVRELCDIAFSFAGLNYQDWVVVDPALYRPAEVDFLRGDSSKAKNVLNWKLEYTFEMLIQEMVQEDMAKHLYSKTHK